MVGSELMFLNQQFRLLNYFNNNNIFFCLGIGKFNIQFIRLSTHMSYTLVTQTSGAKH